jgi:hypothetical protein
MARWFERVCESAVQVSIVGTLVLSGLFAGYLISGYTLTRLVRDRFPYSYLALGADPVLSLLGLALGASVCAGTGGLIGLHMVNGVCSHDDIIALLASFIGFGFGVAIIKVTGPTVLYILRTILRGMG